MSNLQKFSLANLTMGSREIAELVQSRHDDVKRSIERLAERGVIELPPMAEIKTATKPVAVYQVCKRDSYVIVAQLSPEFTAKLVDRWQELENQQAAPIKLPATFAEALRLLADETEAKEAALLLADSRDKTIKAKDGIILASNEASVKAGEMLIREFVKSVDIIDLGEKQFYRWMRGQGLIMGSRGPYQPYVKRGFFTWKPTEVEHGGKYRYTLIHREARSGLQPSIWPIWIRWDSRHWAMWRRYNMDKFNDTAQGWRVASNSERRSSLRTAGFLATLHSGAILSALSPHVAVRFDSRKKHKMPVKARLIHRLRYQMQKIIYGGRCWGASARMVLVPCLSTRITFTAQFLTESSGVL